MVWIIVAIILFGLSILGVFMPILPSMPLAWLGLFVYALSTDFQKIGITGLFVTLFVTLVLTVLDFLAPLIGMQKFKPSKRGMIGAAIGLMLGVFILGPFGLVLGPFVGALIGELMSGKEVVDSLKISLGALVGFLVLSLLKTIAILAMFGYFLLVLVSP